jgi:hypothetical protein
MSDTKCKCAAHCKCECVCGADWTPNDTKTVNEIASILRRNLKPENKIKSIAVVLGKRSNQ